GQRGEVLTTGRKSGVPTTSVNKPQGQSRSVGLSQRMAHPGRPSRRRPADHSKLAALFALVVLSVTPASADDLIEQWLKKDEASAQTVEARTDLNALTDGQWK